jgi:hypothetical protein
MKRIPLDEAIEMIVHDYEYYYLVEDRRMFIGS